MGARIYNATGTNAFPADEILTVLTDFGVSELIDRVEREYADGKVTLLCFEKFYFRTSSSAALTIMANETEDATEVEIVSLAGGEGLLNISWGANQDFAQKAINVLKRHGFEIEEKSRKR